MQPLLENIFREYGLPLAIRSDNGAPFASTGLGRLSRVVGVVATVGNAGLERIETLAGTPNRTGAHERMHWTLKEAVAAPRAPNPLGATGAPLMMRFVGSSMKTGRMKH